MASARGEERPQAQDRTAERLIPAKLDLPKAVMFTTSLPQTVLRRYSRHSFDSNSYTIVVVGQYLKRIPGDSFRRAGGSRLSL